ncbi:MAG: NAD(P)-dependent oxidoreductase, partial [Saprospiraceae bacterium]
ALERGIHLINTPEANCNAVAEHALGMLFSLFRNLNRADYEVRRLLWEREKNRGEELAGKVIGVLGYGHTGARFVELLEGLSVKVLVYDKYKQLSKQLNRYTHVVDADEIRKSANVISLHLPLTTETKNLLDRDFIAGCKNPFYLINTSRGQVVNTIDLIHALHIGKVKGACLDVFENEKPASFTETERAMYEELYRLPQVILSPHIAGWTYQSKQKIGEILLEKLDRVLPRL